MNTSISFFSRWALYSIFTITTRPAPVALHTSRHTSKNTQEPSKYTLTQHQRSQPALRMYTGWGLQHQRSQRYVYTVTGIYFNPVRYSTQYNQPSSPILKTST
eukprot:scpid10785/ scgid26664/ 